MADMLRCYKDSLADPDILAFFQVTVPRLSNDSCAAAWRLSLMHAAIQDLSSCLLLGLLQNHVVLG